VGALAEEVGGADVLEGQEATGLDLPGEGTGDGGSEVVGDLGLVEDLDERGRR
jgi:hypothetical protein